MNEQIGNKINDKTYIKLTPFKGWVLENFPFIEADFDTITNYQLLCKIVEYLNNVISNQNTVQALGTDLVNAYNSLVDAVNSAINEFETDVTADINQFKVDINDDFDEFTSSITTQFNNLHDYVYNYFDNLDVQEEINNKLDSLVSDGTIPNIIGGFVDNYVAETTTKVNNLQEELENRSKGIIAISRSTRSSDHYIYYSNDGIKFQRVGNKIPSLTSDASAIFKINDYYYYLGNNTYQISQDLINWSNPVNIVQNPLSRVWASSLYYDETNEIVYIYSAYQYDQDINTFTNACGYDGYYFKIIYQTATINNDGTLNIDSTTHDLLYTSGESYIDPFVIHDAIHGYVLAVKDEKTCKISIYRMNSPINITSLQLTLRMKGIEGPQLLTDNKGNITLYCQDYAVIRGPWNLDSTINLQTYCRVAISRENEFNTEGVCLLEPIESLETFRHAGLMYCNDKTLTKIENMGINPLVLNSTSDTSLNKGYRHYAIANNLTLVNYPNLVYIFGGGVSNAQNIKIKQFYKNEPLRIVLTNTKVHYDTDSDIQPACKDKYYTYNSTTENVENVTLTIYGRSTSASYGFQVPYNLQ